MKAINVSDGDRIKCVRCNCLHVLEQGKDYVTKKPICGTFVYKCGKNSFLGAINNELIGQLSKAKGRRVWKSLRS